MIYLGFCHPLSPLDQIMNMIGVVPGEMGLLSDRTLGILLFILRMNQ